MKKFKSLVIVCLTLLMMIFVSSSTIKAIDSEDDYISSLSPDEKETIKMESEALNIAEDIKTTFSEQDYGGMYIDNTGTLNIYTLPQKSRSSLLSVTSYNEELKIHSGSYSLAELRNSVDEIANLFLKYNLTSNEAYIDESINKVKVNLVCGVEYPNELTTLLNNNIFDIKYIENGLIKTEELSVGPGTAVGTSSSNFSMAFMAKRGSTVGFVTAGHCINNGQVMIHSNGVSMGKGTVRYNSGNIDAAFVTRTDAGFTPTSTAAYSKQVLNGTAPMFIIQGATVNLEGRTSRSKSGIITSTYAAIGNAIGRIKTSYSSAAGDSGGTMWVGRFIDNTNIYARYIIGIHNGSYENTAGVRLGAYGTRIDTAIDKLGITYYGNE